MGRLNYGWVGLSVIASTTALLAIANEVNANPERWELFPAPITNTSDSGYSARLKPIAVSQPPTIPAYHQSTLSGHRSSPLQTVLSADGFPSPTALRSSAASNDYSGGNPTTALPRVTATTTASPNPETTLSADAFPTPVTLRTSVAINQRPATQPLLAAPVPPPPTLRPSALPSTPGTVSTSSPSAPSAPTPVLTRPPLTIAPPPASPPTLPVTTVSAVARPSNAAPRQIIITPSPAPSPPTVQPIPLTQLPVRATSPTARNSAIAPIPSPPAASPVASTIAPLPVPRATIPIGYTGDRRSPVFTSPNVPATGATSAP
ncbi:MAG: hypothetical protein NZ772_06495 [Cyanobacteria bacterium]|nr:hypothetical protein [Cyanobacteriota bacterium]MDW8201145.1 hypothetical protein [Cyanobacteriota bacterium SKYGB_h_bin112]